MSIATASGDATIGRLTGDLKFQAASGALAINELRGSVRAQTASGGVDISAAVRGAVSVRTSSGEVGDRHCRRVRGQAGTRSHSGVVSNGLDPAGGPADGDEHSSCRCAPAQATSACAGRPPRPICDPVLHPARACVSARDTPQKIGTLRTLAQGTGLRRIEPEYRQSPCQRIEFIGRAVDDEPAALGEPDADRHLHGERPQHRPGVGGRQLDDPHPPRPVARG